MLRAALGGVAVVLCLAKFRREPSVARCGSLAVRRFHNRNNPYVFRDTPLKLIDAPLLEYKKLTAA